tara:strand:+ start:1169 stop:1957 length:789 start_codon:yes stop_codon:yes gene_type:complete
MKVVLLCGGKGTRLGDVTGGTIPKPMAMVGDEPILVHIMRYYARFGFNEFILCAGHLSWAIKSYFLNYHARHADVTVNIGSGSTRFHDHAPVDDWSVTIAETGGETATAGRLRRVAKYLDPDEPFMLTYGDGLSNVDLQALADFHNRHGRLVTMTGIVPPGRFGELQLDGEQVTDWAEKPLVSDRFINGGFMVMSPRFLTSYINDKHDDVMLEREPFLEATRDRQLMLFKHQGFWQCMDTARDWELLNSLWATGEAPWATKA